MIKGLQQADAVTVEPDRSLAIHALMDRVDVKDVVLVAGKGHETYQEIQGVRHPFSDVEQVQAALQRRAARQCVGLQECKA
jgi:UDP-N-acetylmuramoyl-L-alanyl-D-glutamate--2,6-diaminopimelate ligase